MTGPRNSSRMKQFAFGVGSGCEEILGKMREVVKTSCELESDVFALALGSETVQGLFNLIEYVHAVNLPDGAD